MSTAIEQVKTAVELVQGDITELEVCAFVYYARPDLELGSGFGTAIALRGGQSIKKELKELGPIGPGEVAVTSGGNLKTKMIFHAVGPRFQEAGWEKLLRQTVNRCLEEAGRRGAGSIAFPAMGCGFYGIPLDDSARIMLSAIEEYINASNPIERIVICVVDSREHQAFQRWIDGKGQGR